MTPILQLRKSNHNFLQFSGFASLSGYDPAMHRYFEALKQSISDGVPVLIRLHSMSEYPLNLNDIHSIDLESHAVCVIGYDEETQVFAIMDPMKNSSPQWIRADLLRALVVDATQGIGTFLSPLWLEASRTLKSNTICVKAGFYIPKMNVMDKDNMVISNVELTVKTQNGKVIMSSFSATTKDALTPHVFSLNIPVDVNSIVVHANAKVSGTRPYEFMDSISSERSFIFETIVDESSKTTTVQLLSKRVV